MKKNLLIFIILLSFGIIITYPAFPLSHALDSYCTVCNGYYNTADWFLQNGRVITYLFYLLFAFFKLPMYSLGFVSAFLANIFLSCAVLVLYNQIVKILKIDSVKKKIFVLVISFLIYYNPFITSLLVLDEFFVIALGILLLTIAAIKIYKGGLENYLLSFLLGIVGICCYQGISSYFVLVLIILLFIDSSLNLKDHLKKILILIINFAVSFFTTYFIILFMENLYDKKLPKIGNFSLIDNITKIFSNYIPNAFKNYFGYVNYLGIYKIILFVLLIGVLVSIILNKNKTKNSIYSIFIILSCILVPFIPNIFMSSTMNYTDARMILTFVSLPILLIFIMFVINSNKYINYISSVLLVILAFITVFSIHQNMKIDIRRFKEDSLYISKVYGEIDYYEMKYHKKIKKIYYAKDTDVSYYYSFGNANGANVRVMAVDWAFECAMKNFKNTASISKMSEKDYKKYFKDVNYDKFSNKQFVFVDDTLYLLIY